MMISDFSSMGWWAPGMGMIFMVLWLGLIILAIIALLRWLNVLSVTGRDNTGKDALELLNARYARGDIDQNEFQEIRRQISQ